MQKKRVIQNQPPKPNTPLFTHFQGQLLFIVFSISALTRLYFISHFKFELSIETELYREFTYLSKGIIPLDNKPLTGRFCLFFFYLAITNNNMDKVYAMQKYLRSAAALIGCFVPVLVSASLILYGYSNKISITIGILLSIEPTLIIWSRIYNENVLFLIFSALAIFLNSLERHTNHPLLQQGQALCASFAMFTDYTGIVLIFYLILFSTNNKKLFPDLLSLLPVYFVLEISLKILFYEDQLILDPKLPHSRRLNVTIHKLPFFDITNRSVIDFFEFFTFKLPIEQIYVDENVKIASIISPVLIVIVEISAILNYKSKQTAMFLFTIFIIWISKPNAVSSYHISLIFGYFIFASYLQNNQGTIAKTLFVVSIVSAIAFYILYFPWIYGREIDEYYDSILSLLNRQK
ncbi:hypothetical protein TVAG_488640 [Trichomonas vaginalis G3]|uniref:Dolichyl-phosphate-mannose--protein mannosyltransferase n=1 Tax=Trichomonas vaginalis (strain ATCC PRA-98 / G3) TaxID=412133 RepID=A2FXE7_TRIV3|nr:hypothetical protein TVAGG3_0432340 [Trichomonas vaginalis G3]EAX90410.1 hypothetical protein TVAG_488640 [Trichomonas vaginalis G3]KAI5536844.1 hypothetical protein TVAGG3_0432340 [Trichomonas vaginalis G3]|eukprot:XP_001303340.1 hypothetical protein [Trichomonas vaginalis G3]